MKSNPVIALMGIYTKCSKSLIQKDICTPVFISELIIIAKYGSHPKSIERWMDNEEMVCIFNGILFSRKKNKS